MASERCKNGDRTYGSCHCQVEAEAELRGWQGFRGWARIRSHAETTDHSRKLASALVCRWRRSGRVTRSSAWLIPHIFSCDQAALWMVQSVRLSVRLSVRPSVRHTFLTMFPSSYHHEIFRSYYQWQKWRPCKRSRSEVKGQGHRGYNPTLPFPDCNSSLNSHMMMKWCI